MDIFGLHRIARIAREHGSEHVRVETDCVRVAIAFTHRDGCHGTDLHYVRDFRELLNVLGY